MKPRVHFIAKGRYIKAGEEIPDDDVPPAMAKYTVTGDAENAQPLELKRPLSCMRARQKARRR